MTRDFNLISTFQRSKPQSSKRKAENEANASGGKVVDKKQRVGRGDEVIDWKCPMCVAVESSRGDWEEHLKMDHHLEEVRKLNTNWSLSSSL